MSGSRGDVHGHLGELHGDRVAIRVDEERNQRFYEIRCPVCDAPWEREIKPRSRDPKFVEEYDLQIKLVAFDMLLYHMQGEHWITEGEDES